MAKHIRQNVCLFCLKRFDTADIHENNLGQTIQVQQNLSLLLTTPLFLKYQTTGAGEYGDRKSLYERFLQFVSRYFKLENTAKTFAHGAQKKTGDNGSVLVFCESCSSLVSQMCDLYAELNVVKLHLLGKLSRLEEIMKGSKSRMSSKMEKLLMQTLVVQLNVQQQCQVNAFRSRIAIKCLIKNKSSYHVPVIQLDRIPRPVGTRDKDATAMKNQLIILILVYSFGYYKRTFKLQKLKKCERKSKGYLLENTQQGSKSKKLTPAIPAPPLPKEDETETPVQMSIVKIESTIIDKVNIDGGNLEECKLSKAEESSAHYTFEESHMSDGDLDNHDFQNDNESDESENDTIHTSSSPQATTPTENLSSLTEKPRNLRINRAVTKIKQGYYKEQESGESGSESLTELSDDNLSHAKKTKHKSSTKRATDLSTPPRKRPKKHEHDDDWTFKNSNRDAKKSKIAQGENVSTFTCNTCHSKFVGIQKFSTHLESHEIGEKNIACLFCYKHTFTSQLMEFHTKTRHTGSKIICELDSCRQKFESIDDLNEHLKAHVGEQIVVTNSADCEIDKHLNFKKKLKILACSTCKWGFINPEKLELHQICHTPPINTLGPQKFACPKCKKEATSTYNLTCHYKSVHQVKTKFFSCLKCLMFFTDEESRATHSLEHENDFKCSVCNQTFSTKELLASHLQKHEARSYVQPSNYPKLMAKALSGPAKVLCYLCDGYFDHNCEANSLALIHMKTAHETSEKSIWCAFCHESFTHKLTRDLHTQCIPHSESEMRCVCNYKTCCESFNTVEELNEHLKTHLGSSSWMPWSADPEQISYCKLCNWGYFDTSLLALHELVHISKNDRVCTKCPERFSSLEKLQFHFQADHMKGAKVRMTKCTTCGQRFYCRVQLLIHFKKKHSEVFNCHKSLCTYFTWSKERLQYHLKQHEAVLANPVDGKTCTECNMQFQTKEQWRVHMFRKHNIGDGHQCPVCGKIFPTDANVRWHMHVHNEGRYHCHICQRKFKRTDHLQHHISTHTNSAERVPQFICTLCGKGYMTPEGLKCHISGVHTPASEHKFKCTHCSKVFHRNMLLKLHIKTNHKSVGAVANNTK